MHGLHNIYTLSIMVKRLAILILLTFQIFPIKAQQRHPSNGDTINYVHCLFEIPSNKKTAGYEITITSDKEAKNSIIAKNSKAGEKLVVTSGLEFGHTYYWRYRLYDKAHKNIETSNLDSFHIAMPTVICKNTIHINDKDKIRDGYIVLDNGTIIDRNGHLIWFLPDIVKYKAIRNLNLNKDGNLTFLTEQCYEIDLRGNVLWTSPDTLQGKNVTYHHDFKKLDNGNFLCVAEKVQARGKPPYSIVFEITPHNKIKWMWDEEKHYENDSLFKGSHINSASLDKSGKYLYVSSRNMGSVMKIDIATGKIEYNVSKFFSGQHALTEMQNGNLLLFNNNTAQDRNKGASSILMLTQPTAKKSSEIAWEYVFNFTNERMNFAGKLGDADELENGNILVYTGNTGLSFEVNRAKEIVWECITEEYIPDQGIYSPIVGYRTQFLETLYPIAKHPSK